MSPSIKCLTLDQVMISRSVGLNPLLGSVLTAQSLEPVSDPVSPSLSASPLLPFSLSLSLFLSQKISIKKKKRKMFFSHTISIFRSVLDFKRGGLWPSGPWPLHPIWPTTYFGITCEFIFVNNWKIIKIIFQGIWKFVTRAELNSCHRDLCIVSLVFPLCWQNLNYLFDYPLQKKFANPWIRI